LGRFEIQTICLYRTRSFYACLPAGRLSGVLNSDIAIQVHIQIIRVYAKMRELLLTHKEILLQLEKIEKKLADHDEGIALIFQYLRKLLNPAQPPRKRIGFRRKEEND